MPRLENPALEIHILQIELTRFANALCMDVRKKEGQE
jgi:hypothetical protein